MTYRNPLPISTGVRSRAYFFIIYFIHPWVTSQIGTKMHSYIDYNSNFQQLFIYNSKYID